MPMFLEKILKLKREEVLLEQKKIPLDLIKNEIGDKKFSVSLVENLKRDGISIIAELKKASPSLGVICEDYFPDRIAKIYEENGAAAISVLTEKNFFMGDGRHLIAVKNTVNLPVLRKDFIISEYQIYQSKRIGADVILLIAGCLDRGEIESFLKVAKSVNIECLVEIHNEDDLKKIEGLQIDIIGINNRNLKTFAVNLETSYRLKDLLPSGVPAISESGIKSAEDIKFLKNKGFKGVLIGEVLMKSSSPGLKLKEFLSEVS
ncbi:indole-3-glycerol phosphate synthase TrpC [candidate division KSB1 bacterium]